MTGDRIDQDAVRELMKAAEDEDQDSALALLAQVIVDVNRIACALEDLAGLKRVELEPLVPPGDRADPDVLKKGRAT